MDDLISRSALLAQHDLYIVIGAGDNICIDVSDIAKAPAVDAVPVVRCKDCKYRHDSCFAGNGNTYCDKKRTYFPLDGFCSYGERRGNDGK